MNRGRLAKLERAAFPRQTATEAEREAVALLDCITEAELDALAGPERDAPQPAHVASLSNAALAAAIFHGRPDLLATCRARLAAKGAA